jgi:integrase
MLTIFRRHLKNCEHRSEGRKYRRCRCPIWVDGVLHGIEMRRSLELRDWERAQMRIREWEAQGVPQREEAPELSIEIAFHRFVADAESRGLRSSTLKKYDVLFRQLKEFAGRRGLLFLKQLDLEFLRMFRQDWKDSGISAVKKLERLRAFLNFAHESSWIDLNPGRKLKNPRVTHKPTLPFSQDEMISILAACNWYPDNYGNLGGVTSARLRAFVLLLRYSGMRIGDAASAPSTG